MAFLRVFVVIVFFIVLFPSKTQTLKVRAWPIGLMSRRIRVVVFCFFFCVLLGCCWFSFFFFSILILYFGELGFF